VRRNDRDAKTSEVVYIDYGNSETQPWSALRVLNNDKFGMQKLRPQALDAAMSFAQFPTTSPEYLADAVAFLNDIAVDRQLVANVDFTDSRENLLWVTLLDPAAKDQTESLNAEVISEGLAMVPKKLKPFERANVALLQDLKQRESVAKNERRGQWEYGDLTED
jgi:staphylococcal nuclease domain-containing protein 1